MLSAKQFTEAPRPRQTICLGLVFTAQAGGLARAHEALTNISDITIGEPQGNRIPACIFVERGTDKERIAQLERVQGVLLVDVAYAHTLEEDEVP